MHIGGEMRQHVLDLNIPHQHSGCAPQVTVSIGVADAAPRQEQQAGELLARADRALYEAKEAGRNRVQGGTDA